MWKLSKTRSFDTYSFIDPPSIKPARRYCHLCIMSSQDPNQQRNPARAIPYPPRIPQSSSVPAGDNHPLAAGPIPTPSNAGPNTMRPDAPGHPARLAPGPPPKRSPVVAKAVSTIPNKPRTNISSGAPAQTLDSLADAFLSNDSYRTTHLGLEPILRPPPLPPGDGIDRLRTLVERRAWGDVLKLSTSILSSDGPHADVYSSLLLLPTTAPRMNVDTLSPEIRLETVEVMTLQCNAWLKLRRYADLGKEIERWNFLTQNDVNASAPDWLPWSIKILAGQARQYFGDANEAADILQDLQSQIPKDDPVSLVWVNNALANLFLLKEDFRLALVAFDQILKLIPEATEEEVRLKHPNAANHSELCSLLATAYKCEILCRQGRTLLQAGALPQVAEVFEYARSEWTAAEERIQPDMASHPVLKLMSCQMQVNEALFYFGQSNMEHAMESITNALELLRSQDLLNQRYDESVYMGTGVVGIDATNILYSECVNNLALCSLYTCEMKDAVNLLEDLIRVDPTAFLTERVAFNLCTLYELGADSAVSARRKRVLQLIAKRFFLHDIGPESFRVN
eukprot:scaffold1340_cov122-Cylindrotheca_fusiformis.AAC.6